MNLTLIYTIVGFALAGWSVIANDSIQTLGTFIASKEKWFKWYTLAGAASAAMALTIAMDGGNMGVIYRMEDLQGYLIKKSNGITLLRQEYFYY